MNKAYGRIDWQNYPSDETPINESNLNKSVLKRYRNPNIQNFAKRFFLWAETVSGKRKSGLPAFNGSQCKQDAECLRKRCAKRSTGSSQMEKSDKQIIQYNIHRTRNCDEIHRTFRIPQSAENRTDHIIRRNKRNLPFLTQPPQV